MDNNINFSNVANEDVRNIQERENLPATTQQQNPFAVSAYNNVGLPDIPINMNSGIGETLLGNEGVPDDIKEKFWFVFQKDNILTFLDETRKASKLLNFDIVKIDSLNSMGYYDYDFGNELQWNILRNVFETRLDRSLGFKANNVKNERIVLQSQFSEMRNINDNHDSMIKEGFFKRLLGRKS